MKDWKSGRGSWNVRVVRLAGVAAVVRLYELLLQLYDLYPTDLLLRYKTVPEFRTKNSYKNTQNQRGAMATLVLTSKSVRFAIFVRKFHLKVRSGQGLMESNGFLMRRWTIRVWWFFCFNSQWKNWSSPELVRRTLVVSTKSLQITIIQVVQQCNCATSATVQVSAD